MLHKWMEWCTRFSVNTVQDPDRFQVYSDLDEVHGTRHVTIVSFQIVGQTLGNGSSYSSWILWTNSFEHLQIIIQNWKVSETY